MAETKGSWRQCRYRPINFRANGEAVGVNSARARRDARRNASLAAAKIILQRLADAGFKVGDEHAAGMQEVRRLRAEIERLEDAKRRALQLADERAKEANALRSELDTRRNP